MLHITQGKGFQMKLENGWTVSVQFGEGNYCGYVEKRNAYHSSPNAEVAAWDANGVWHKFENEDTVYGWQNTTQVLAFINTIAALPVSAKLLPPGSVDAEGQDHAT